MTIIVILVNIVILMILVNLTILVILLKLYSSKKQIADFVGFQLLPPGCNIVDIGANVGDTTLPLAVASRGICLNFC